MAETSRSRVTITLGPSGQVVKRSLDTANASSQPAVGSKRSVRDRLGSNVDSTHLNNKRQRGDSNRLSTSPANGVEDMRLGRNDLRFRIMQKNVLKQTQSDGHQNGVDLREMLSRPSRPSTASMQQRMSEQANGRHHMAEPKDVRQRLPEPKDVRQRLPEPKDVRQRLPEPKDVRQYMPEPTSSSLLGRNPSLRTAHALPPMVSYGDSYSPWTLDRLRRRSPDGLLGSSRGLSPPRNDEELQRRPVMRTYDDGRTVPYMSKDVLKLSRPTGTTSFMTKPALTAGPANAVAPLVAPTPPLSSGVQKSPYTVDEQHTVEGLLHSLGLEKYSINFKAEEVDMTALRQMGDIDLKELGIPMGPRKKILLALLARSKRRQV